MKWKYSFIWFYRELTKHVKRNLPKFLSLPKENRVAPNFLGELHFHKSAFAVNLRFIETFHSTCFAINWNNFSGSLKYLVKSLLKVDYSKLSKLYSSVFNATTLTGKSHRLHFRPLSGFRSEKHDNIFEFNHLPYLFGKWNTTFHSVVSTRTKSGAMPNSLLSVSEGSLELLFQP